MSTDQGNPRRRIDRLVGMPVSGQVVLEYIPIDRKDLPWDFPTPDALLVRKNGFDKYRLRSRDDRRRPCYCWLYKEHGWGLATLASVVNHLSDQFCQDLRIHPSAVEKVADLLGYDPTQRPGEEFRVTPEHAVSRDRAAQVRKQSPESTPCVVHKLPRQICHYCNKFFGSGQGRSR